MESFIIAEIGSNCLKYYDEASNLTLARKQIEAARKAGADAVKFQMFTSKELYGVEVADVDRWAMPIHWLPELYRICVGNSIEFMCSAFSVKGYSLVDKYVKRHKVASSEATALDIATWLKNQDKPVIWSKGCGDVDEPNSRDIYMDCVVNYPADFTEYSFKFPAIDTPFGLSDHTLCNTVARIYRANGASYFEKHVDLVPGTRNTPDSPVSIGIKEFREYCQAIREQPYVYNIATKVRASRKYGRQLTDKGWFRPLPEELCQRK